MLELPDVRQRKGWTCGKAATWCVLQHFGRPYREVPATPADGTDPRTIEAALFEAGLAVASGTFTVADLNRFTRSGRPVICAVQYDGEGHWVVVSGVRYGKVHYQCPRRGPCKEPEGLFLESWHDRDRHQRQFLRFGIVAGEGE